jgi:hypothetical protein
MYRDNIGKWRDRKKGSPGKEIRDGRNEGGKSEREPNKCRRKNILPYRWIMPCGMCGNVHRYTKVNTLFRRVDIAYSFYSGPDVPTKTKNVKVNEMDRSFS